MKFNKFIISATILQTVFTAINAQSFIYIQGDKETPIYVKVEGQMMPRLGMNYCIVPNLESGLVNFEILFQGNKYPSQKYKIRVPKDGGRSLILTSTDNSQNFALYDIQSQGLIYNGNGVDNAYVEIANSQLKSFKNNLADKKTEITTAINNTNVKDLPAFNATTTSGNNNIANAANEKKDVPVTLKNFEEPVVKNSNIESKFDNAVALFEKKNNNKPITTSIETISEPVVVKNDTIKVDYNTTTTLNSNAVISNEDKDLTSTESAKVPDEIVVITTNAPIQTIDSSLNSATTSFTEIKDNRFIDNITLNNQDDIEPKTRIQSNYANKDEIDNILGETNKTKQTSTINTKTILNNKEDGNVKSPINNNNSIINTINYNNNSIPNTDCINPMSIANFESLSSTIQNLTDDDAKLKYIKRNIKKYCFTTNQINSLGQLINGQSTKFELYQVLYPNVSDPENYSELESSFNNSFLKNKFKELVK